MSGYMYDAYGAHAADPYGQAYGQMVPAYGGLEEVRTIFITGFPLDVKERELNNLLRFVPGYEVRVPTASHARVLQILTSHHITTSTISGCV